MTRHQRFSFKHKDALLEKAAELGVEIPFSDSIGVLFEPVKIGKQRTVNRFAVHPMEGYDAGLDGSPQELTFRRYLRYAAGGSGLIWFEATAVDSEGRSNPHQCFIHKGNAHVFKRLAEETRKTAFTTFGQKQDLILVLQLTHSGRFSKPEGNPRPIIAHHSPALDPLHHLPGDYPLITDDALLSLQDRFEEAALLAAGAGFDGVDIKACHGYLVSELLAAYKREDSRYGGPFENRIRFLVETAAKIKDRMDGLFVTSRLNLYDGIPYPYGFGVDENDPSKANLNEPKRLVKQLMQTGFPCLSMSLGIPYLAPHIGRPYDVPLAGMQPPDEHPLSGVARLLCLTGELQTAYPGFPVVGTGYSWLRQFIPHVAAGAVKAGKAALIGQGRGAFAYPDSVRDLMDTGRLNPRKMCVACSGCTQRMRSGGPNGCVVRDREIYSPVKTGTIKNNPSK